MRMKAENSETTFVSHLGEMRRRIIFTLTAFLVSLCGAFVYVRDLYRWLVRDLDFKLAILAPSDVIWVYLKLAAVAAMALTLPIAAFQAWRFVKPALHPREQRAALAYIPWLPILFISGIAFGYFVIFPMVLHFLENMSEDFVTMYTADRYFTFLLSMSVPFGLLFEMPLAVMFLTRIGILNPSRLAKWRKLSYFMLTVTAVAITPPDIMSDVLVIIPLLVLYEASVWLAGRAYSKREKRMTA